MAKVVAEERSHGERVVHYGLALVLGGSRGFGLHGSTDEYAVLPVKRLVHERYARGTPAAEQNSVDGDTFRRLPIRIDDRTLFGRRAKPVRWTL